MMGPRGFKEPLNEVLNKPGAAHQRPTAFSTTRKQRDPPKFSFSSALKPANNRRSTMESPYNIGENLFTSAKKQWNMVTPKQSGHNFAMPQSITNSARLSRQSKGGKENARNFSDKEFLRRAQEEILGFLAENQFELSDPRQIIQPSIAMVSRVFEFLVGCLGIEVVIKNGKDSKQSLDTVIPEVMTQFNYPFAMKKSDFVSFVGDRQRGTIYHVFCFLIALIHNLNFDEEEIMPTDFNLENDRDKQFQCEALKLFLDFEQDDANQDKITEKCEEIVRLYCGSTEEVETLKKEIEKVRQSKQNVIDQVQAINLLPMRVADLKKEIQLQTYALQKINFDIETEVAKRKTLERENSALKKSFDALDAEEQSVIQKVHSQKLEVVREYKLSVMQIEDLNSENKKLQMDIESKNDKIASLENGVLKQKESNRTFLLDIETAYNFFFENLKDFRKAHWANFYQEFVDKIATKKNRITELFTFFRELDIKEVNDDINSMIEQSSTEFLTILSEIQAEFQTKTINLNHKSSELISQRNEILKEHRTMKNELEALNSKYEALCEEYESMKSIEQANHEQLTRTLDEQKKEFLEIENRITALKKDNTNKKERYYELKKDYEKQMKEAWQKLFKEQQSVKNTLVKILKKANEYNEKIENNLQKQNEILSRLKVREE